MQSMMYNEYNVLCSVTYNKCCVVLRTISVVCCVVLRTISVVCCVVSDVCINLVYFRSTIPVILYNRAPSTF